MMKPDYARNTTGPRVPGMVLALVMCVLGSGPLAAQVAGGSGDKWNVSARAARKPNPIRRTNESIAKGQAVFKANCVACHGTSGRGDGPSAAALATSPGNLTDPRLWEQTDGVLYWKVRTGKAPMPTFGTSLTKDQIWHVVNFVRTLSTAPPEMQGASTSAPGTPPEFYAPDQYLAGMSDVLSAYLSLQEALVGDDMPAAQESAPALEKAVSKLAALDAKDVPRAVQTKWMMTTRPLQARAKSITASKDLTAMRRAFRTLSVYVVRAVQRFGHAEAEAVHLFSCPLAFGKSGATWLQRGDQARNPYLGEESSCGELQEVLGGGITTIHPDNSKGGTR